MPRSEKPCVLLVDDNEATCTLITALLRREFEIQTAYDGSEAIEQLKTRQFAAVLLDLRMPGVDGFGVLEFLSEHNPEMLKRVLIVSAALGPQQLERAREYGVAAILRKPFEIEVLVDHVRSAAGLANGGGFSNVITPMILLLADLLRQTRW
jgi:putative two-component system response regulator